jgi:nucleoid DNA-binding protein
MPNKLQKSIVRLSPHPALVKQLSAQLIKHGSLKITGFGIFKLKRSKGSKKALNPYTQKFQSFPPKTKIVFKPIKSLKEDIQKWKN